MDSFKFKDIYYVLYTYTKPLRERTIGLRAHPFHSCASNSKSVSDTPEQNLQFLVDFKVYSIYPVSMI